MQNDREQMLARVRDFWELEACGERSATGENLRAALEAQAAEKYRAEPYIAPFAKFETVAGKTMLEVGVGMGADHARFARARPAMLCGVDLTMKALEYTATRLSLDGMDSHLHRADAQRLPFASNSFDLVYSWGALHHIPSTETGISEVHRVLKPGGTARVMLYHRGGLGFRLLWLRHSLLKGRPFRSFDDVMSTEVESYGTKAFSRRRATEMFSAFARVDCRTTLTMADLLEGPMGRRHGGPTLTFLKKVWPRPVVRLIGDGIGSDLLIEAVK
jgi:ubiquinone/menaquinone biosynthesis C-methylase UbiE